MSCPLSKYSNMFGAPKTGFHSFRLFDIAVNDLLGTVAVAGLITYISNCNFMIILILLLVIGILMHRIFCVNTTINKKIFGEII